MISNFDAFVGRFTSDGEGSTAVKKLILTAAGTGLSVVPARALHASVEILPREGVGSGCGVSGWVSCGGGSGGGWGGGGGGDC